VHAEVVEDVEEEEVVDDVDPFAEGLDLDLDLELEELIRTRMLNDEPEEEEEAWEVQTVSTVEFDPKDGGFEWEIVEHQVRTPTNYAELQQRIAEKFPKLITSSSILAVEWPDGKTVDPRTARFSDGHVVTVREFVPHKMMRGATLLPELPPRLPFNWDRVYENQMKKLRDCWSDTERFVPPPQTPPHRDELGRQQNGSRSNRSSGGSTRQSSQRSKRPGTTPREQRTPPKDRGDGVPVARGSPDRVRGDLSSMASGDSSISSRRSTASPGSLSASSPSPGRPRKMEKRQQRRAAPAKGGSSGGAR